MTMMRCNAELTIQVPGTAVKVDLWPGLEVDVEREIAPARQARAAKGEAGAADFEPGVTARPAVTIASAVGGPDGLALYFEPVAKAAKAAAPKKTEE